MLAKNILMVLGVILALSVAGSVFLFYRGRDVVVSGIYVDIYDSGKACNGTTLFAYFHDSVDPRIIEVNMDGEIVWEYLVPEDLKQYTQPGFDAELLSDNNVLIVFPGKGVYEIDRSGNIIWKHEDEKISHDADRLPNGNTIHVFGANDQKDDFQVKEVDPNGQLVWSWRAKDEFDVDPYRNITRGGWTHANAVTRLENGDTLISLRNFGLTVLVSPSGSVVKSFDWSTYGALTDPHEPEVEPNGNLLVALQRDSPYQSVEINMSTEAVVWTYSRTGLRTTRDCDRLPNGNTLMVGVLKGEEESVIFEVVPDGEIVWQLRLKGYPATGSGPGGLGPGWFYKAQRICQR